MRKFGIIFLAGFFFMQTLYGQSTLFVASNEKEFTDGMKFYKQGILGAARNAFENFLQSENKKHKVRTLQTDQAEAYIALIALQTYSADAEKLTSNAYTNIHNNSVRKLLAFHYAVYKFDKKAMIGPKTSFTTVKQINNPEIPLIT